MCKRQIPYAEWINYIRVSREKGRKCFEFEQLCDTAPMVSGNEYDTYIHNEIAKLEVELIRSMVDDFQKSVNRCFEEQDLFVFEIGLREFKKAVRDCLFFDDVSVFSEEVRNNLKREIRMNLAMFIDEFSKYMRRLSEYEGDVYVNEFFYMYKKANIKKFVREQVVYE